MAGPRHTATKGLTATDKQSISTHKLMYAYKQIQAEHSLSHPPPFSLSLSISVSLSLSLSPSLSLSVCLSLFLSLSLRLTEKEA